MDAVLNNIGTDRDNRHQGRSETWITVHYPDREMWGPICTHQSLQEFVTCQDEAQA